MENDCCDGQRIHFWLTSFNPIFKLQIPLLLDRGSVQKEAIPWLTPGFTRSTGTRDSTLFTFLHTPGLAKEKNVFESCGSSRLFHGRWIFLGAASACGNTGCLSARCSDAPQENHRGVKPAAAPTTTASSRLVAVFCSNASQPNQRRAALPCRPPFYVCSLRFTSSTRHLQASSPRGIIPSSVTPAEKFHRRDFRTALQNLRITPDIPISSRDRRKDRI